MDMTTNKKKNNTPLKSSITKEELRDLPLDYFKGNIMLVNSEETLKKAVEEIKKEKVWGFDTETKPSFKKGQTNKMALIQLANNQKAFLFQIKKTGLHPLIASVLSDDNITKIGLDIKQDLQKVREFVPNIELKGFVDIQKVAKERGFKDLSLKKLAGIVLGVRISKRQQLSNWERKDLTPAQKRYAATDAWIAYLLYKKFYEK